MRSFDRAFVDRRRDRIMLDTGCAQHLPANGAGRGEDQGQADNLVEKRWRRRSANMGMHSIGTLFGAALRLFEHSSTGANFIPSL